MPTEPLTLGAVADRYGVTPRTVAAWIRAGELRAVNVGRRLNSIKPRLRITAAALEAFESLRTVGEAGQARRRRNQDDVIRFYG